MEQVPIAVVEQETGLSKDVLRKWEVRYGYPTPLRNEHGDRVYDRDQIARLRLIKRLMDAGYRPSRLFAMAGDELEALAISPRRPSSADDVTTPIPELLELLRAHQPMELKAALRRLMQSQGLKSFVHDTMAPLCVEVGEAWSRGQLRVFEEHLFSDVAHSTLRQALEAIDSLKGHPRILMTTLPGEQHSLGLLMVSCMLTLHGAHCIYLGVETPGEEIAAAVQAHHADVVALSFSSAFPVRQIAPALRALRLQVPPDVALLAGGGGVARQKPVEGVHILSDLASVEKWLALPKENAWGHATVA